MSPRTSHGACPDNWKYEKLFDLLSRHLPAENLIRDAVRTLACGTDASFYRLIPKLIVRVASEADVVCAMRACTALGIPFTFRAAGTSLSGQAISDSVVVQLSRHWNGIRIGANGSTVTLQPAVLGSEANRALAHLQRKIGPDPASIDSAMVAGIAANNASGMCCGNVQDTYHTMDSVRIVFADGSVLDTASEQGRRRFVEERPETVAKIKSLAQRVRQNAALSRRIRHKYRIKNTTGYSLHALIDFEDPLDIVAHLLVGSEGTLAFISEITYKTVPDEPSRATGLLLFPNIYAACDASFRLTQSRVAAVELMDRECLRSVEARPTVPGYFRHLDEQATALLVEVRANSSEALTNEVEATLKILSECKLSMPASFIYDEIQSKRLWEIRKGLYPSLGHTRPPGTTIVIEDVAFPPERLPEGALDLRRLLQEHGYREAVIFGHALQGNLHFVFCANFTRDEEVSRYKAFLDAMATLVSKKYDGSLKAEHGTGRNMAPFVEREWGADAVGIMREIKEIFDPNHLLNPGVILNSDPNAHILHLKDTPRSHPIIEKCTECGFCERTCPSNNLSLTPRQRIVVWREISHLAATRENRKRLRQLRKGFAYAGVETCAADGLCATLCPVGIDTGAFITNLRGLQRSRASEFVASVVANHFAVTLSSIRVALRAGAIARSILGTPTMYRLSRAFRALAGQQFPQWNSWLPVPPSRIRRPRAMKALDRVVYFPCCVSRVFGVSENSPYSDSQNVVIERLLSKAGYEVLYPNTVSRLCCGMAFFSKGYASQAEQKSRELFGALARASRDGKYPIVLDTSPCAQRLRGRPLGWGLRMFDLAEFLLDFVTPRLQLERKRGTIAVHVPCSLTRNQRQHELLKLGELCAEDVCVPHTVPCCGFAGDKGFTTPELSASALVTLKPALHPDCRFGYSTSRTCEIGLSLHSGISYQSVAYLVDEAVRH
jgi:D-lactate dehydrogenase